MSYGEGVQHLEEVGPRIYMLDSKFLGFDRLAAVYFIEAPRPAVVETSGSLCSRELLNTLERSGVDDLAYVVVSHIHLDHAGGVGHFHARFPNAKVVVHPSGAPHLADPARLHSSVERVYGRQAVVQNWGYMLPVDPASIVAAEDGHRLDLGNGRFLEILHTPGHAKHHVAIVDSDTGSVFLGDSAGVYVEDSAYLTPSTPPPDLDPIGACASLDRILERKPVAVYFSHFGRGSEPNELLETAKSQYLKWLEAAERIFREGHDQRELVSVIARELDADRRSLDDATRRKIDALVPHEVQAAGYFLYLERRRMRDEAHRDTKGLTETAG